MIQGTFGMIRGMCDSGNIQKASQNVNQFSRLTQFVPQEGGGGNNESRARQFLVPNEKEWLVRNKYYKVALLF